MIESVAAVAGLKPRRRLKVLVADDNIINQRVAVGLLTQLGHTGVVVSDGEKVLRALSKLSFDVLLMDVMMPNTDGLEALATLRAQEEITGLHLPVLMVTSYDEPGDGDRFRRAGADFHVPKPLQLQSLHTALERFTK